MPEGWELISPRVFVLGSRAMDAHTSEGSLGTKPLVR
jgi:hypothetical protein